MSLTCHACKQRRPDSKISVASASPKRIRGATTNVRYCNDTDDE